MSGIRRFALFFAACAAFVFGLFFGFFLILWAGIQIFGGPLGAVVGVLVFVAAISALALTAWTDSP